MARNDLTAQRLRELFEYNDDTGVFTRRIAVGRHGRHKAGTTTHTLSRGYFILGVDHGRYAVHRLAWLYVYGAWPSGMLDHIDGNRTDNRICNLRLATPAINSQNQRRPRSDNTSGFLGVSWHTQNKKWRARLTIGERAVLIGLYNTPEAAHAAYVEVKRRLHEGCTI